MKRIAATLLLSSTCCFAAANDDTVTFNLSDSLDVGNVTPFTKMSMDIDFGTRYINVTGSIYSDDRSENQLFDGVCEIISSNGSDQVLCRLNVGFYTGRMTLSLADLSGGITLTSLLSTPPQSYITSSAVTFSGE